MRVFRPKTAHAAKADGDWQAICEEVAACDSELAVRAWWRDFVLSRLPGLPADWSGEIRTVCQDRLTELKARDNHAELDAAFRATVGAPGDLIRPRRTV